MYDKRSREQKAKRIIKLLQSYYGTKELNKLTLLDIGASTGIIDNYLAKSFKKVTGVDIDINAISFARKKFKRSNLIFQVDDAMKLSFKINAFDVVVCTHIYEHVSNSNKLFSEIYRVLKPQGVCYLAAINRFWPLEPHYNLLFLSWFPKKLANLYVQITGKSKEYYENPKSYWGLKKLTKKFKRLEYTQKMVRNPKTFGFEEKINGILSLIGYFFSPLLKYFTPTFFWLLIKENK